MRIALLLVLVGCSAADLDAVGQVEIATLKARAALGDGTARYKLGMIHEQAMGVPGDLSKAVEYFRAGAEAKNPACMGKFALYLVEGIGGVTKDVPAGMKMLEEAVALEDPDAAALLAECHYQGWYGLKKDQQQGRKYLEEGCRLKSARAFGYRGGAYEHGIYGYTKDSAASRRDYVSCAQRYEATAIDLDDAGTQTQLYFIHKDAGNIEEARVWQDRAIAGGSYHAIRDRGTDCWYGSGGQPKDLAQAYAHFNLASGLSPEPFPDSSKYAGEMRELVAKEMTKEQIADAQRITRELRSKLRK